MKNAVFYCRISTDRQNIDRQYTDLTNYAKEHNITILKSFGENCSGRVVDRNGIKNLIAFCLTNNVDEILVHEVSRLGRNSSYVMEFIRLMTSYKVNIHFLYPEIDTLNEDKTENFVSTSALIQLSLYCEHELQLVKDRLNSGREIAKANGVKMGRKVGYKLSDDAILQKYPSVIKYLKKGNSIRDTAKLSGVSLSTVQRVKKFSEYWKIPRCGYVIS